MKKISVLLIILCFSSLLLGCAGQLTPQAAPNPNAGPMPELASPPPTAEPTLIPSPISSPTLPPTFKPYSTPPGDPDPYFGDRYIKGYRYNEWGYVTSITVGQNVINGGGPGNVFVSVTDSPSLYASKVFYMDKGEEVEVKATFNASFGYFNFSVRAALPGDISQGNIEVKRP